MSHDNETLENIEATLDRNGITDPGVGRYIRVESFRRFEAVVLKLAWEFKCEGREDLAKVLLEGLGARGSASRGVSLVSEHVLPECPKCGGLLPGCCERAKRFSELLCVMRELHEEGRPRPGAVPPE